MATGTFSRIWVHKHQPISNNKTHFHLNDFSQIGFMHIPCQKNDQVPILKNTVLSARHCHTLSWKGVNTSITATSQNNQQWQNKSPVTLNISTIYTFHTEHNFWDSTL